MIDQMCRAIVKSRDARGGEVQNVLWYSFAAAPEGPDLLSFATNCAQSISALIGPPLTMFYTTECIYSGVEVLVKVNGVTANGWQNEQTPGNNTGDTLPSYAAAVLRKYTSLVGRRGRGRFFLANVPEAFSEDNTLSGAGLSAANDVAAAIESAVMTGEGNLNPGLYSETLGTFTALTMCRANSLLGRMGSRRQQFNVR